MTDRETRTALPSTPVVAHRGWVKPMPRRSRLELVIWATAVLFGSTIGGTLALRAEPASSQPAAAHPTSGTAGTATNPPSGGAAPTTNPASGGATATTTSAGAAAVATSPAGVGAAATTTSAGAAAVATSPASGGAAVATNPGGGAAATATPAAGATAVTAASVGRTAAIEQIHDALRRFVSWSHGHTGARCPDAAALGAQPDPWGHALRITCTDQPADQIAGVVSAGPDGVAGTRDDIESWALGDAVTDPVRGPRWRSNRTGTRRSAGGATAAAPPPPPPASTTQPRKPPASPGAGSSDNDGDGIPDRR